MFLFCNGRLRKCSNWLKERYFSNLVDERSEYFPVEWRSSLKLDGGIYSLNIPLFLNSWNFNSYVISDTLESITLHQVRGLREFLNYSAMDVLYYTSPMYRMEVSGDFNQVVQRMGIISLLGRMWRSKSKFPKRKERWTSTVKPVMDTNWIQWSTFIIGHYEFFHSNTC